MQGCHQTRSVNFQTTAVNFERHTERETEREQEQEREREEQSKILLERERVRQGFKSAVLL